MWYIAAGCWMFTIWKLSPTKWNQADFISIIITILWNYESIPQWRNMITNKMTPWLMMYVDPFPRSCTCGNLQLDYPQLVHWFLHLWVEPNNKAQLLMDPHIAFPTPMVLIFTDFKFILEGKTMVADTISYPPSLIACICICWCTQKNKQNGKTSPFFHIMTSPRLCPVAATLQIVCKVAELGQKFSHSLSIQAFTSLPNPFHYIINTNTTAFLRLASKSAHNLLPNTKTYNTSLHHKRIGNLVNKGWEWPLWKRSRKQWSEYCIGLKSVSFMILS